MFYKLPTAHIHNQKLPYVPKRRKKKKKKKTTTTTTTTTTPCSLYIKLSQVPIKKNKTTSKKKKKKSHSREGCVMR